MKAAGATPDLACYNALLRACARAGDVKRDRDTFERLKSATTTSSFIVTIQCSISTQPSVCHRENFKTTAAKQFFNCWKEWQVLVLVARWLCTHAWLWDRTPHRFWLFQSQNLSCKSPSSDVLVFGLVWWKNSTLSVWFPRCLCFLKWNLLYIIFLLN